MHLAETLAGNDEEVRARLAALTEEDLEELKRIITKAEQPGYVEKATDETLEFVKDLEERIKEGKAGSPEGDEDNYMKKAAWLQVHQREIVR